MHRIMRAKGLFETLTDLIVALIWLILVSVTFAILVA